MLYKCNLCISFLISFRYFCCLNKLINPYQFHAYQNGRPGVKLMFGRFLQLWFGQLAQVSGLRAEEVISGLLDITLPAEIALTYSTTRNAIISLYLTNALIVRALNVIHFHIWTKA